MRVLTIVKKYKKISSDFLYNFLASAISTGTQQLVVYPFFAFFLSKDAYGELLTIMGIIYICSVALGNSLNNVRLIQNSEYIEHGYIGDFNIIAIASILVAPLFVGLICFFFFQINRITLALICVLTILETAKAYYCVSFRLELDFLKTLKMALIAAIFAGIGCIVVYVAGYWPLVFILADVGGIVYLFRTSSLFREPLKKTLLFGKTLEKLLVLISSGLVSNVLTYLDRLVLYPVMGGSAVAIYTVAAFFGKTLGIVVMPISSVMLGYYAQKGFKMDSNLFWRINIMAMLISGGFLLISILIAEPITGLLYPKVISKASDYIFLANLGAVINVITYIVQPAILKFVNTKIQLVKEILYAVIYVGGCLIMIPKSGILGLCWVMIIANSCKLIFLLIIGSVSFKTK